MKQPNILLYQAFCLGLAKFGYEQFFRSDSKLPLRSGAVKLEKDFSAGFFIVFLRNESSLIDLLALMTRSVCFQLQPRRVKNEPVHGRWDVDWNFSTVSTYEFQSKIFLFQKYSFPLLRIIDTLIQKSPLVQCKSWLGKIKQNAA